MPTSASEFYEFLVIMFQQLTCLESFSCTGRIEGLCEADGVEGCSTPVLLCQGCMVFCHGATPEASPGLTAEYRWCLLESLASTDRHVAAEKLEALDLCATAAQLKADHSMCRMLASAQEDRKVTMNGLIWLVDIRLDNENLRLLVR